MTLTDELQTVVFIGGAIMVIIYNHRAEKKMKAIAATVDKINKRHEKAFKNLTDPDAILADMERGAVAMEALQANRSRMIREDAGPHARIIRPKNIRAKYGKKIGK
jgi:pyridoxal/pyridoxine/pyridoxamine kinase